MSSTGFYLESKKIIKSPDCIKTFSVGLALGFFYFLMMLFGAVSGEPLPILDPYWGISKLIVAASLICLYRTSEKGKYAGGGIILAASSLMTIYGFLTGGNPLAVLLDALSIVVISLTLHDIGKAVPQANLEKPAGAIFIGVMLSLVGQPQIAGLGLLLVVIGMVYAVNRVSAVYAHLKVRSKS